MLWKPSRSTGSNGCGTPWLPIIWKSASTAPTSSWVPKSTVRMTPGSAARPTTLLSSTLIICGLTRLSVRPRPTVREADSPLSPSSERPTTTLPTAIWQALLSVMTVQAVSAATTVTVCSPQLALAGASTKNILWKTWTGWRISSCAQAGARPVTRKLTILPATPSSRATTERQDSAARATAPATT